LPVHTYVLVFLPDGMPDNPPNQRVIRAGDLTLVSEFTIIKAWELSAEDALAQNNENLLPFIPLMRGGGEKMEQCAQALGRIEDETRQRAILAHFVSIGSLRYNRESIIQMLGRTTMQLDHILRETPYIQSIISEVREETLEKARKELREEVREEAIEQARKEMREEMREEAQHQTVVELLLLAIGKRFPGHDFKAEVERALDTGALKQLVLDLDQIPDAETLRARLAELAVER
jgi:hypothetical protein